MATWVAFLKPSLPIIAIYDHDIGKILLLPKGEADTAVIAWSLFSFNCVWPGRKGDR